jgi:hypothetical protein
MASLLSVTLAILFVPPLDAPPRTGTVAAVRVYVVVATPEGVELSDDLSRCADSLRQALTPSLGTLVPAERRSNADMIVEVKKCEADRAENVFQIETTITVRGKTENLQTRRTLTRAQSDDWQMRATAKGLAQDLLRMADPDWPK